MLSDDVLYPASAGTWIHIVRQNENEAFVCGVYDSIQAARENCHRHQFNDDEVVSYVLNAPPLLYDARTDRMLTESTEN